MSKYFCILSDEKTFLCEYASIFLYRCIKQSRYFLSQILDAGDGAGFFFFREG